MLFDGIRVRVGTGGGQAGTTTQVVEAELRDLLKRLERAFKEEVPVKTGETRESIRGRMRAHLRQEVREWRLRFTAKRSIGYLIKGTKPHEIDARPGRAAAAGGQAPELRMTVGGSFVFAPRVAHPGMHAVPGFIRRAVDKALPQSKNELRTNLRAAVLAELRSVVRDGIV